MGVWLIVRPIFPTFQVSSPIFSTTLQTWLRLPHPSITRLPNVCAHIPLTLWVSTSYVAPMVISTQGPMMQFVTLLSPLCEMSISMWDENNYMCFFQPHSIFPIDESALCSIRWNSHFSWCCHSWPNLCRSTSLILHNSKNCYLWCSSSQRKELPWSTPHRPICPFNNWSIWMFKQIGQYVLTWLCQYYFEHNRAKRPSSFYLSYFSLSKNFNYITKDASILHLKLGSSNKPSYFSTSTPLEHTSHRQNWPITSDWLLKWRIFDI